MFVLTQKGELVSVAIQTLKRMEGTLNLNNFTNYFENKKILDFDCNGQSLCCLDENGLVWAWQIVILKVKQQFKKFYEEGPGVILRFPGSQQIQIMEFGYLIHFQS